MASLLTELGLLTYEDYLKEFENRVENRKTSSKISSPALIAYTKLNLARSRRLHKTILINANIKREIEKLQRNYTWMVLTEAWCGDSAQNIPVIAEIAALNTDKIKLFILLRDEHSELMDNYLTNGSRSIPKLIAIDETLNKEAFVWGPRPATAQDLLKKWKNNPEGKSWEDFEKDLHTWYANDKSQTIQSEFFNLLKIENLVLGN